MVLNKVYQKGKTVNWGTPRDLYKTLNEEFEFDYEPCKAFSLTDDLLTDWGTTNFLNPPFDKIPKFVKKILKEQALGKTTVMLCPARTGTNWFHNLVLPNAEIRFLKGKLKFVNMDNPGKETTGAMFASILCIFRGKEEG